MRRDLFAFGPALGQHLKLNDVWCEVIGVLADRRAAGAGARPASGTGGAAGAVAGAGQPVRDIFLPVTTAAAQVRARAAGLAAGRDPGAPGARGHRRANRRR